MCILKKDSDTNAHACWCTEAASVHPRPQSPRHETKGDVQHPNDFHHPTTPGLYVQQRSVLSLQIRLRGISSSPTGTTGSVQACWKTKTVAVKGIHCCPPATEILSLHSFLKSCGLIGKCVHLHYYYIFVFCFSGSLSGGHLNFPGDQDNDYCYILQIKDPLQSDRT